MGFTLPFFSKSELKCVKGVSKSYETAYNCHQTEGQHAQSIFH